jgi:hypothetical protein
MEARRTNQRVTMTRWWGWRADGGRENPQRVTATRWWWWRPDRGQTHQQVININTTCWWLMWLALQAEGSVWLALQVEGAGEPPTSRNDSLGVGVAGIDVVAWSRGQKSIEFINQLKELTLPIINVNGEA